MENICQIQAKTQSENSQLRAQYAFHPPIICQIIVQFLKEFSRNQGISNLIIQYLPATRFSTRSRMYSVRSRIKKLLTTYCLSLETHMLVAYLSGFISFISRLRNKALIKNFQQS